MKVGDPVICIKSRHKHNIKNNHYEIIRIVAHKICVSSDINKNGCIFSNIDDRKKYYTFNEHFILDVKKIRKYKLNELKKIKI